MNISSQEPKSLTHPSRLLIQYQQQPRSDILEFTRLPQVMRSDNSCGEMLKKYIQIKYWCLSQRGGLLPLLPCLKRRVRRTHEIVRRTKRVWCAFSPPEEVNPTAAWLRTDSLLPMLMSMPVASSAVCKSPFLSPPLE